VANPNQTFNKIVLPGDTLSDDCSAILPADNPRDSINNTNGLLVKEGTTI